MSYVAEIFDVEKGYETDGPVWIPLGTFATVDKARRAVEREAKRRWRIAWSFSASWFAKEFRDGDRVVKFVATSSKAGRKPSEMYPKDTIARVWW